MFLRTLFITFVGLSIAASCDICAGQAFFPLARVSDTSADTSVTIDLRSTATADAGGPAQAGPIQAYTDYDTNYTIVVDASSVEDGDSHADSEALSEAEILPAASSSLMLAQCITNIGGLWEMASTALGLSTIRNSQAAQADGYFEIEPNPTYPTVGLGTLYATFDIDFVSLAWDAATINAHCGSSHVTVDCSGGFYTAYGYLAGYGSFYDFGETGGPLVYTAFEDVVVYDVIPMGSSLSANAANRQVAGGGSASEIPGLSLTTSFYVSER